ncbi:Hypothetical predicted protein, partial [Olea europaea subsp. europaea]
RSHKSTIVGQAVGTTNQIGEEKGWRCWCEAEAEANRDRCLWQRQMVRCGCDGLCGGVLFLVVDGGGLVWFLVVDCRSGVLCSVDGDFTVTMVVLYSELDLMVVVAALFNGGGSLWYCVDQFVIR